VFQHFSVRSTTKTFVIRFLLTITLLWVSSWHLVATQSPALSQVIAREKLIQSPIQPKLAAPFANLYSVINLGIAPLSTGQKIEELDKLLGMEFQIAKRFGQPI
jgi:hypothetical protein